MGRIADRLKENQEKYCGGVPEKSLGECPLCGAQMALSEASVDFRECLTLGPEPAERCLKCRESWYYHSSSTALEAEMDGLRKVGIVGSRRWVDEERIREFIEEETDGRTIIVSGGCKKGADAIAKKLALDMDRAYVEFPPKHEKWNDYCFGFAGDYDQPYDVGNYHARNKQIAEYSDLIVAFIPAGMESRGTMSTVRAARRLNKEVLIIGE